MIYVISKSTFGSYNVRDIQCNANWDCCPYSDYALIPDNLVEGILATKGYCDITLDSAGTTVASFTARTIPAVPRECCSEVSTSTTPKTASGSLITEDDSICAPLLGLKLYGKTTQNGTPTPDAPVNLVSAGASGTISARVTGKNLFGGDALADKFVEVADATKDTEAGTVTATSNNMGGETFLRGCFKPNTRYTFILYGKCTTSSRDVANLIVVYTDSSYDQLAFNTKGEMSYCVYTSKSGKSVYRLGGSTKVGSTILQYNECGVFEGVLTEADFVPYVSGGNLTAQTPNGLNSIGDIKDEIDFVRGVRVQKIGCIDSYAGEEIPGAFVSTTGELSTGAKVLYALTEPIETPLSAEELAQYAALHTNKPETIVYNDAAVDMEVSYFTSNAAVPMNYGQPRDSGKILAIDECGCVAKKKGLPSMVGIVASNVDITVGTTVDDDWEYYDVYK